MSEQIPNRPEELVSLGVGQGKSDSQLRLITADGNVVFPEDHEPTDDTPTIISKNKPSEAIQSTPPTLSGNLRGRRLAHFELLEPIGVGGMAAVLRARDTQLERFVALKILPPDMAQDMENVRRFHQEARAAAKLDHENIARVFYCGEDQKLHFIAFEFVEGVNLRVLLDQRGRLPVPEAVRIILQVAAGLEHAASRGVVHRDVKPSNIIISPNGRAKLVDMGLARSLEPHNDGALTQSGVTLGTFDYISPEQALEPREADSRSDVYSLGCTFYHMLTGQPPVPEGTAAKKLHHHQHVAPVDPRQFNPDIPDEVAVVLSRMMAKDPKDRYHRPALLVQHLLQVAQKVGAADDVPEGVLFVDAAMPGDPRKRPLLLVSLGALALALLLVLLSLAPQPRPPQQKTAAPHADNRPTGPKDVPVSPLPSRPGQGTDKVLIKLDEHLPAALGDKVGNIHAILMKSIDLPPEGLVFQGDEKRKLTVASDAADAPKSIHFKYTPRPEAPDMVAGLLLDGGTVTFSNIRFVIEASKDTPEQVVASLGIRGTGTVLFQNCVFVQKIDVPAEKLIPQRRAIIPIASVAVDNPAGGKGPTVILDQCSFSGGQVAVGINGPAQVVPTNCAFKSYGALFHLRGDNADPAVLKLKHCSAFIINGPAFRVDDRATCHLEVAHSIFSRPDNAPSEDRDEPDLIRQTDSIEPAVKYTGRNNCYHNLNALWVRPKQIGNDIRTDFEEFRALVQEARGDDKDSYHLTKETAIWYSPTPWSALSLKDAFRLRQDVREVRTPDLGKLLGFEKMGTVALYPVLSFPKEEVKTAEIKLNENEKVVDPDATENRAKGVFKHLFQALALAEPKDVIYIKRGKNSRNLQVKPTVLDQPAVDVTLRPWPGQEKDGPIINMDFTGDNDAAFFRLQDGALTIEHLEFVLDPDQDNFKAMAVVFMSGNASCTFKNCVITMRPSETLKHLNPVALSIVALADLEDAMKMPSRAPRSAAEIHFHDCFIRGAGEVVNVRASRPLEISMDNTVVGLAGSLLGVQAAGKEPAPEAEARIRLNQVSTFLTKPLLTFRAGSKSLKGFVPTRVNSAQNSLFVRLGDNPFIQIEANDITEDSLHGVLDYWKGEHNAYCNFERMLNTVRPEEVQPFFSMNPKGWVDYYKETDPKFPMVQFNFGMMAARSLWTALPEHFAARPEHKEELAAFGANLNLDALPRLTKKETPSGSE